MNLAYRMRPRILTDFVGQEHLVGKGKIIRRMLEGDNLFSMIFWGPPGSGKTSLAFIISAETQSDFQAISGVTSGKEDLLKTVKRAALNKQYGKKTILFIDEIHRWNKAKQDALLPHVEKGLITLIGATTENPSFEVISPLLSRCKVFVLNSLDFKQLESLLDRALKDKKVGLGNYKKTIDTNIKTM